MKRWFWELLKLIILAFTGVFIFVTLKIELENSSLPNADYNFALETKEATNTCESSEDLEYLFFVNSEWKHNNKVGLYIYAENKDYFEFAQTLVNSKGGDWGYVLIPYNVKDQDYDKWDRVFSQLRNKHLIPIIQLWDVTPEKYKDQTEKAASFLNQFVWPVKHRYISAYNEMNDAKFWYGRVDAAEYARILDYTIDTFKSTNSDYFILNGAFNVSASNTSTTLDAFYYMFQMDQEIPGIFSKLDGWASHSYPQPEFSGSPYAEGRWSIRAYEKELDYLRTGLKVSKELPVFITETGWAHAEGERYSSAYLPASKVAEYIKIAFEQIWMKDDRIRAVTPFTVRYNPPYDHFSWINKDGVPYQQYETLKSIKKVEGDPPHVEVGKIRVLGCD